MVVLDIIGLYSCGIESQDCAIKSNNVVLIHIETIVMHGFCGGTWLYCEELKNHDPSGSKKYLPYSEELKKS